ncbi:hypothetical protein MHU86_22467 [Fragilaria crotonensis]|nr:hypothetical protein MHU86_22467 [Fragilaria crotonensis]
MRYLIQSLSFCNRKYVSTLRRTSSSVAQTTATGTRTGAAPHLQFAIDTSPLVGTLGHRTLVGFMVRHNGLVSRRRAVDYLLLLSDCSIDHFYPGGNVIVELDDSDEMTELGKAFRKSQSQVFKALGDMGGELILSLAVVDDKELCRATSGSALWYILHQGLMRPFVIGIVFIDFVLHITLMLSFRSDVMVSGDLGGLSAIPSAVVTGEKYLAKAAFADVFCD